MGNVQTINLHPAFSNINISYCNAQYGGYSIEYPNLRNLDDFIFKYGTFVENDSPTHYHFYAHWSNTHRIFYCNYIQKNNQGDIYENLCNINISDSIFIINPNHQYIKADHLFHCNINGVIYDDEIIRGKDIFQNPIFHYETDECRTSILILDKECQIVVNSCPNRKEFVEKYILSFPFLVLTELK